MRFAMLLTAGLLLEGSIIIAPPAHPQDPHLTRIATIGKPGGPDAETFGYIVDAVRDGVGNIYVLDAQAQRVSVFSPQGLPRQRLGRPGRGPGEFFLPRAMTIDGSGHLYVLDSANQRVQAYTRSRGQLQSAYAFEIPFQSDGICTIGNRLYILGYHNGRNLHEFTQRGKMVRSFGSALGAHHPVLRSSLSTGVLACDPESGSVFFLPLLLPELRAYSSDGRLRWTTRIPEYNPTKIERAAKGGISFKSEKGTKADMASSVILLPHGTLIVQTGVQKRGAQSRHDFISQKSYAVSVTDGKVRKLSSKLPRLLSATDAYILAAPTEPYPRVELYSVAPAPIAKKEP